MTKDPGRGVMVADKDAPGTAEYQATRYWYSAEACGRKFVAHAEEFVK